MTLTRAALGGQTDPVSQRLAFALDIAARCQTFILGYYQQAGLVIDSKHDTTPVTEADRGAERLIREGLKTAFPDDAILGEEYGETPGSTGYRWILDPVDGTKSFVHGVPLFGTLIGIEHDGRCVAGVCRFPALDEVVYAAKGQGAWWQTGQGAPRRAQVSRIGSLSEATFCATNMLRWEKVGRWPNFMHMLRNCGLARGWGDCFGHILVATGRAEIMVDPQLTPWDSAALLPIVEEAGGHFLDLQGNATIYGGSGFSVNAQLKDEVLKLLNQTEFM